MTEFRVFGEERTKYTVETVADYKEIVDEIKATAARPSTAAINVGCVMRSVRGIG